MAASESDSQEIHLPMIRIKRPHRKSRFGCLRCKQRRVKCDERRPACSSCEVRSVTCDYPGHDSQDGAISRPARAANSPCGKTPPSISTGSSPYLPSGADELDVGETELAECYLSRVSHSFGSGVDRSERDWVWQVHIPSLALCNSTVRDGMYALAAIYLHFSDSQCTSRYVDAADFYGSRFVGSSRAQFAQLSPSESDANMVCAKLLFVLVLAGHRENRNTGLQYSDPMMWTWAHMLSGLKAMHQALFASGQTLHPTMLLDMTHHIHSNNKPHAHLPGVEASPFHRLLVYIKNTQNVRSAALHAIVMNGPQSLNEETHEDCLHTVQILHQAADEVHSVDQEDVIRVLGSCVAQMPTSFVGLLEQQHHVALVVFSHWLLMLISTEDLWVVDDMGRAGIQSILATVKEPELEYALSFPREALEFARMVKIAESLAIYPTSCNVTT